MFSIYKITNNLDGNFYIGYTTKSLPEKRFAEHIRESKYRRRNFHLYNAFQKYGVDNFSFSILELGENDKYGLTVAEPLYIKHLRPAYNTTSGGEGSPGHKWTEEHRLQHSLRMRGENGPNFGKPGPMLGKKHSEETKALMRFRSKVGIPRTLEVREKISQTKKLRYGKGK